MQKEKSPKSKSPDPKSDNRLGSINWAETYRRIDAAQDRLERGWTPSLEEKKRILKERTKLLAEEPKKKEAKGYIEVVEFLLAYERYAIESSYVREVYPMKELTPLPDIPTFVLGIINVRGQILSVIDIKKFFELPEKGLTDLNRVIIIHDQKMEFGVLADSIIGVRMIGLDEIQPSLPTLTGVREEYLKGVTKERVVILDAGRLLSDKKIVVHQD